jgi:hypothetical protein
MKEKNNLECLSLSGLSNCEFFFYLQIGIPNVSSYIQKIREGPNTNPPFIKLSNMNTEKQIDI